MSTTTREVHLAARPQGRPTPECFAVVETELPDPGPDEVLVRNLVMSVDPYMRPRMDDRPSYVPPYRLDAPLDGGAVGVVEDSRDPALPPGTLVAHGRGWREHAIVGTDQLRVLPADDDLPPSYHLGLLGGPGLTAYAGLRDVARLAEGDTVYVSGGAGAVGSLVGQLARLMGAGRVVGSAGSPAKVAHMVDELGLDDGFDHHEGDLVAALRRVAPDGVDVYFDNVGGDHLAAALEVMNHGGRIAVCGAISTYDDRGEPCFTGDLFQVIARRLTLRGFISTDHAALRPELEADVREWLRTGELVYRETVEHGLDRAAQAFLSLLSGVNVGKMVVTLADESPAAATQEST
ncbi:NADP-dependent oxidoreductase [Aeromicrobium sp. CTD01-1L150]|uniref:NADP-dependent oxidoreductase n=1 Tax=Aeromicrobium sp. CTD01-1L150 TaxID=3341830 RepID=UPI0035C2049A